ncbi:MAG: hypothetical protein EBU40_15040 [Proteobacteria bacterium]|nr:hypothetical protein [Pseudomonadota bacterium]
MVDVMDNLQDDLKRARATMDRAEEEYWTACDALPERSEWLRVRASLPEEQRNLRDGAGRPEWRALESARYSIAEWHAWLASQTEVAHLEKLIRTPEVGRHS